MLSATTEMLGVGEVSAELFISDFNPCAGGHRIPGRGPARGNC